MMPDRIYGREARSKINFRAEPYQYDGAQTEYIKASIAAELAEILAEYRTKTPLGNQPHMIADRADQALATYRKAMGE